MCTALLPLGVNPNAINKYIKSSFEFQKHLQSPNLQRQTKCILYRTLKRPLLTYGSECWSLPKEDGNMLRIFERRILRKIHGPINDNGTRRTRYNNDLYTLYDELGSIFFCRCGLTQAMVSSFTRFLDHTQ
jgi:hypothetical protein